MLGTEEARRVVTPCRGEHDIGAAALQETFEACKQRGIDNVRQLARVRCPLALQNAVDIEENDFMRLHPIVGLCLRNKSFPRPVPTVKTA